MAKQWLTLGGESVLRRSARLLADCPAVDDLVVVVPPGEEGRGQAELQDLGKGVRVVAGGAQRADSVLAGLEALEGCAVVLVHDAARPFASPDLVLRVAQAAAAGGAALAALPVTDTVKRASPGLPVVAETLDRRTLWLAQTPQGFRRDLLLRAYQAAGADASMATDECGLVERLALVVVSHPHPDHTLGLAAVAAAFPVEEVILGGGPPDGEVAEVLARLPAARRLRRGQAWERAGVRLLAVSADDPALEENDASLVLRVEHGRTALLLTGDLEGAGEAAALAASGPLLRADLVKVPHHGSRTSSSVPFVELVRPTWAVASLGAGNRFGFPHAEAEARWRGAGAAWARTDQGAARFLSDGEAFRRVPAGDAVDPLAVWRERRAPASVPDGGAVAREPAPALGESHGKEGP